MVAQHTPALGNEANSTVMMPSLCPYLENIFFAYLLDCSVQSHVDHFVGDGEALL
jgi:hypothetical protein